MDYGFNRQSPDTDKILTELFKSIGEQAIKVVTAHAFVCYPKFYWLDGHRKKIIS